MRPPTSGWWVGEYWQYDMMHTALDVNLDFLENGHVSGFGVDGVGKYHIAGRWTPQCIWFEKKYLFPASNKENLGHVVLYTSTTIEKFSDIAVMGFEGTWSINNNSYQGSGSFKLTERTA